MFLETLRSVVSRRPGWVVLVWLVLAAGVGLLAPNLTKLAAEGQARMLGHSAESVRTAAVVNRAWPDESYEALAVVALHRPDGLTAADRAFAVRVAEAIAVSDRPRPILRVLGPNSPAEIADRLLSPDATVQLVAVPISESYVAPVAIEAVNWLQRSVKALGPVPAGLEVRWTGDAVLGRDMMANVQTSLDRAAMVTVVLLLVVLLIVYRSIWLALVPLTTIGISLVISRGLLAWLATAGWEISPLVELFLVAVLFGTGTDFCLFISWRFGEHWQPDDPGRAMRLTLVRSALALLTSAGTVIAGLALMGTTQFKLFSSTGPSVALGLVLTLAATLTLTPALLVLLSRFHPRSFGGWSKPASRYWDRFGHFALDHPGVCWVATVMSLAPLAALGLRTHFTQDMLLELPAQTESATTLNLLMTKFDPGMLAPMTIVLESDTDLHDSEGLDLIDDLSRMLSKDRKLVEVRSATQPLGSPRPLARARIASRVEEVADGFGQIADGAAELRKGLTENAAKLRMALWLERRTGLKLIGAAPQPKVDPAVKGASNAPKPEDPNAVTLRELSRAAEGAGRIANGAKRARHELAAILDDPVGRRALDHLLVTPETIQDNPELLRSFAVYVTPDGHHARLDTTQAERIFSGPAMDQVLSLRRRLNEYLAHRAGPSAHVTIAGVNAESADIRTLTRSDQFQSWFIVPIGVFLVLVLALRDPLACLNLVATMLLTYLVALGATHLVFITLLGSVGIDWKVPYFLFVLLVAVGVDYNVFLMDRARHEIPLLGLRGGLVRAVARTGGLITSAAAITACSFASFLSSPLSSLRQLGFALVVGITVDAVLVRPLLVPCGHWLLHRRRGHRPVVSALPAPILGQFATVAD